MITFDRKIVNCSVSIEQKEKFPNVSKKDIKRTRSSVFIGSFYKTNLYQLISSY